MRIGELAALVGVSTRTIRHYHHLGLLPEPARLSNGYREYRLRDAVILARVRRLAELGLSLDEVRDVLADDRGRDLREVLLELDADLAGQQRAIGARRDRLAALLADADLDPDSTVSADMAAVLRAFPAGGSAFAEFDRALLAVLDTAAAPEARAELTDLLRPLAEPETAERGRALYARLDEIAGADPADPRIAALAADLAGYLPDPLVELMAAGRAESPMWLDTFAAELPAAQAAVFRRLMDLLEERR